MTEAKPTSTWTCDRCGATVTIPMTDQPKGWTRAHLLNPPRAAMDGPRHVQWDLCPACETALVAWRKSGKPRDLPDPLDDATDLGPDPEDRP